MSQDRFDGQVTKKQKQKWKQDIFSHFLEMYQPNLHIIKPAQVVHEIQHLYQLIADNPKLRNQRSIKKLKAELSQMNCFKIPPYNQTNPQFMEIFKRDTTNIINMISPFVDMTNYTKGSIVQPTGVKRQTIKILIIGEVAVFQPVNQKCFKNCQQKLKNGQISLSSISNNIEAILRDLLLVKNQQNPQQNVDENNIPTQNSSPILTSINQQIIQHELHNYQIGQILTIEQCRKILTKLNIISPLTPHKYTKTIIPGSFLFDKQHPMFIDQNPQYYSSFICCTNCIFLQIRFQIAKQVIYLIKNDRERPYIQSLLFKFPMLKYFEAKQYVTQQFMITNQIQEQQDGIKSPKKSAVPIIKQLKIISSLNYQLSYTGQIYLIIHGSVTMIINQISQRKPSNIEYAISQKRVFNKQIFHLYKNDIFGFEEIGENKSANLRYLVSIGSKLLKINNYVFKNHLDTIPQLKQQYLSMKETRNEFIKNILQKMEVSLQNQEIQRHQSITYSKSANNLAQLKVSKSMQLRSNIAPIMQLKYYGHQSYESVSHRISKHFSPETNVLQKQVLSPQIVKSSGLGIQFSRQLLKHPNQAIQIKDGWIQTRNKKGIFVRKKRVKQTNGQALLQGKGDPLLRRLGVLSSQQIATHNHQMVKKRPSKYEFEDLKKQANQFKKIKKQLQSLPKLTNFYAKKQDRLFTILYKKTHL